MPKFRVVIRRTALLSQRAVVTVDAENKDDAVEAIWDEDPAWRTTKVHDDSHGIEVERVTEVPPDA